MSELYLTPASLSFFNQTLLALFIMLYLVWDGLIRSKRRSTEERWAPEYPWLLILFGGATLFSFLCFWIASASPSGQFWAVYLLPAALASTLLGLIQFAYRFPTPAGRKLEAWLALAVTFGYAVWVTGCGIWQLNFLSSGEVVSLPVQANFIPVILCAWVVVIFIRQARRQRGQPGAFYSRVFALIFLVPLLVAISNALHTLGLVTTTINNVLASVGLLLTIFFFSHNYLQARAAYTSFVVRLAGAPLTGLLVILGIVGWFVGQPFAAHYPPNLPAQRSLRFSPNAQGGYDAVEIPWQPVVAAGEVLALASSDDRPASQALSFAFPFFDQIAQAIYVSSNCSLGIGQEIPYRNLAYQYGSSPAIFPLYQQYSRAAGGEIFAGQETDRLVITCQDLPSQAHPELRYTMQVVLHRQGTFEIHYGDLPAELVYSPYQRPEANPWFLGVISGAAGAPALAVDFSKLPQSTGPGGMVQDEYLAARRHLDDFLAPVIIVILISSLVMVIVFPLDLRTTVLNPLNTLLRGVKAVKAGATYKRIPVTFKDEIGYLTGAFNQLHLEYDRLVANLEERVYQRTADLVALNERLQESEQRYRELFDLESDALFIIRNEDGRILEANAAASALYGYTNDELLHLANTDLSDEPEKTRAATNSPAPVGQIVNIPRRWHRKKDGTSFPVEITARFITWKGHSAHLAAIRDSTERQRTELELERLAVTDPLTGLYNRRHFFAHSNELFTHARQPPFELAALMVDIDHFKNLNDHYGHAIGDQVLCEVGRRLTDNLRTSDVLARYGGEEFAVLLPRTDHRLAGKIAERLLHAIRAKPFELNGLSGSIRLSAPVAVSIGVAMVRPDMATIDELMLHADQAMYQAKQRGRNCWVLWEEQAVDQSLHN